LGGIGSVNSEKTNNTANDDAHIFDIGAWYEQLYGIVKKLRSKDGCPWDRRQTVESLSSDLLEEVYECLDAFATGEADHVKEELGDLHLLAVFIGILYEESGEFTLAQVLEGISEKLIRRHPHVFAEAVADTPDEVVRQWDTIKEREKQSENHVSRSFLDDVPRGFPPLERSYRLQKRSAKKGLDWNNPIGAFEKLSEEFREVEALVASSVTTDGRRSASSRIEEELGDLLFSVVNLSRHYGIDPGIALHKANQKFCRRVRYVEERMGEAGLEMKEENLTIMDEYWNDYKQREK
jgi:tetrapyrrole methylase family protein / MazG family protein